jgi:hypothetical protein
MDMRYAISFGVQAFYRGIPVYREDDPGVPVKYLHELNYKLRLYSTRGGSFIINQACLPEQNE